MTVSELILKLSQFNQNDLVVLNGYENGFEDINEIIEKKICKSDPRRISWWDGEYDICEDDLEYINAILLSRDCFKKIK